LEFAIAHRQSLRNHIGTARSSRMFWWREIHYLPDMKFVVSHEGDCPSQRQSYEAGALYANGPLQPPFTLQIPQHDRRLLAWQFQQRKALLGSDDSSTLSHTLSEPRRDWSKGARLGSGRQLGFGGLAASAEQTGRAGAGPLAFCGHCNNLWISAALSDPWANRLSAIR
jgi:hypothetical protein